ncbi:hypothetical protein BDN67DRAFT_463601 [Paxillus ammoniavirescens]|nr:hypothetical protein BDN67DRAFT_463601 [Paxillus ammoniavirescens]
MLLLRLPPYIHSDAVTDRSSSRLHRVLVAVTVMLSACVWFLFHDFHVTIYDNHLHLRPSTVSSSLYASIVLPHPLTQFVHRLLYSLLAPLASRIVPWFGPALSHIHLDLCHFVLSIGNNHDSFQVTSLEYWEVGT